MKSFTDSIAYIYNKRDVRKPQKTMKMLNDWVKTLDSVLDYRKALNYYTSPNHKKLNKKLKRVEQKVLREMMQFNPFQSSSFHAGMNISEETDIDLYIFVSEFSNDLARELKKLGYKFYKRIGTGKNTRIIYHKIVDGIEIEIKIRIKQKAIIDLHKKMINLDRRTKVLVTYGKHLLYKKKLYKIFKYMVYESQFYGVPGNYLFMR